MFGVVWLMFQFCSLRCSDVCFRFMFVLGSSYCRFNVNWILAYLIFFELASIGVLFNCELCSMHFLYIGLMFFVSSYFHYNYTFLYYYYYYYYYSHKQPITIRITSHMQVHLLEITKSWKSCVGIIWFICGRYEESTLKPSRRLDGLLAAGRLASWGRGPGQVEHRCYENELDVTK